MPSQFTGLNLSGPTDGGFIPVRPKTSRLALTSLALGVISVFAPAAIVGIFLGHWSQIRIARSQGRLRGSNVAAAAIFLNYLGIAIFGLMMWASYSVAVHKPNVGYLVRLNLYRLVGVDYNRLIAREVSLAKRAKSQTPITVLESETVAVDMARSVAIAEVNFRASHGKSGFTCDLNNLLDNGLDRELLGSATRTGYTLQLQGCDPDLHGLVSTYQVLVLPPAAGGRAFCIDQEGLVRAQSSDTAETCFVSGSPVR